MILMYNDTEISSDSDEENSDGGNSWINSDK